MIWSSARLNNSVSFSVRRLSESLPSSRIADLGKLCMTSSSKIGLPFTQARTVTLRLLGTLRLACFVPDGGGAGNIVPSVVGACGGSGGIGAASFGTETSACCNRAKRGDSSRARSAASDPRSLSKEADCGATQPVRHVATALNSPTPTQRRPWLISPLRSRSQAPLGNATSPSSNWPATFCEAELRRISVPKQILGTRLGENSIGGELYRS